MILFEADEVLSRRYRPAWMALSFASGGVNAGAYFACERTVTHITGIVSRIGMASTLLRSAEFMLVLGAFVVGAAASVLLIDGRFHKKLRPLYTTPLRLTSLVLALVAVLGWRGAFGVFGETVDLTADFVLLALLAFASGLQNAALSTMTRLMVRTTHMTGHATDLGMGLALLGFTAGEHRAHAVGARSSEAERSPRLPQVASSRRSSRAPATWSFSCLRSSSRSSTKGSFVRRRSVGCLRRLRPSGESARARRRGGSVSPDLARAPRR